MADSKPNSNIEFSKELRNAPLSEEKNEKLNNIKEGNRKLFICGFGSWRPQWLQRLANAKAYLLVFCLLGILQGAYFSYLVGVMSTLEKRFAFESKVSGLIMIADNITPILLSVLIGYYGSQAHRPKMVGFGMLAVVLSCYMCAVPYFVFGPATHLLSTANFNMSNTSKYEYCDGEEKNYCSSGTKGSTNTVAVTIFFIASALEGIGSAAFYTVGAAYLDDNIKKKQTPMYFSTMFALRMLGPSLGYLLSSLSLKYFEDPFYDPGIGRTDPRWIGAWWIGFIILGTALLLGTIPMFMFPRHLNSVAASQMAMEKSVTSTDLPSIRDMPRALARLGRNPILVCHTFSIIFRVFGYLGYYLFLPKYMETQFRQSASTANFYTGSTSLITQIVGVLIGGAVVRKLKPRPRFLVAYMMVVEFFTLFSMLANLFVGCPPIQMNGVDSGTGRSNMFGACNAGCGCSTKVFAPVCGTDSRTTYFTPCFAGCVTPLATINDTKVFEECNCMISEGIGSHLEGWMTDGYCPTDCRMFVIYIALISVSKTVASTSRIISTLLTLRCIDPKDKSLTLGALDAILSILAFIPAPLVFGALTDSACLVWEKSCGKTGNCWFYDSTKFRQYIHGAAFSFIAVGTLFDLAIFFMSGRLKNFYDDEDQRTFPMGELGPKIEDGTAKCGDKNVTIKNPVVN